MIGVGYERAIEITQIVSPHQFWFTEKEPLLPQLYLRTLEEKLDEYFSANTKKSLNLQNDDVEEGKYAYYYKEIGKWALVRIDEILAPPSVQNLIIWAVDYGKSFLCSDQELYHVPPSFTYATLNKVFYGGLSDIVPSEKVFCVEEKKIIDKKMQFWSAATVQLFKDIVASGQNELFFKTLFKPHPKSKLQYGELKIGTSVVNNLLVEMKSAIATTEFNSELQNLPTLKRWGDLNILEQAIAVRKELIQHTVQHMPPVVVNTSQKPIKGEIPVAVPLESSQNGSVAETVVVPVKSQNEIFKKELHVTAPLEKTAPTMPVKPKRKGEVTKNEALSIIFQHQAMEEKKQIQIPPTKTKITNILHLQDVFVYGGQTTAPISNMSKSNFAPEVLKQLKDENFKIFRIQSYSWPHIMNGSSIIMVHSRSTGKTMGFVPAICSQIMDFKNSISSSGDMINGPFSIILCHSSATVKYIGALCKRYCGLNRMENNKVVMASGTFNISGAFPLLLGPCYILVTTPPCFMRLIKMTPSAINHKKLKHFVVDDYDLVANKYKKELNAIQSMVTKDRAIPPQYIFTSSQWLPCFESYLQADRNMEVCFGDFIQVAVFRKTKFVIQISAVKMDAVMAFMHENNYATEKTLIVCRTAEEVEFVAGELKKANILRIKCNENVSNLGPAQEWTRQKKSQSVLVCNDEILPELKVGNVKNLIHYSMAVSWTLFLHRFVSFKYVGSKDKQFKDTKTFIALDADNNLELPRLINFIEDNGLAKVMPQIRALVQSLELSRERSKKFMPLCTNIFEFGACANNKYCRNRHFLTEKDDYNGCLPKAGTVKFNIIRVHSPTHYAIKLMEHKECHTFEPVTQISTELQKFSNYMNDNRNSIVPHHPVLVDDICGIFVGCYQRCKILEVMDYHQSKFVYVKLIDDGKVKKVFDSELLAIPEEYKLLPPRVIDMYMNSIVPFDDDESWDEDITKAIEQWIKSMECYFIGTIEVLLSNSLVLRNVKLVLKSGSEINLQARFISMKYGVPSALPMELLQSLVSIYRAEQELASDESPLEESAPTTPDAKVNGATDDAAHRTFARPHIVVHSDKSESSASSLSGLEESKMTPHYFTSSENGSESTDKNDEPPPAINGCTDSPESDAPNGQLVEKSNKEISPIANSSMSEMSSTFDEEEFKFIADIFQRNLVRMERETVQESAIIEEVTEAIADPATTTPLKISNDDNCAPNLAPQPRLAKMFKEMETTWMQSESIIILSIRAPDVKDFTVDLIENEVFVQAQFEDHMEVMYLQLFGCVDPIPVTRAVRGLNIVLRLHKLVPGLMWPHVMKDKKKLSWLKHNHALLKVEEEYRVGEHPISYATNSGSEGDEEEGSSSLSSDECDVIDDLHCA